MKESSNFEGTLTSAVYKVDKETSSLPVSITNRDEAPGADFTNRLKSVLGLKSNTK